MEQKLSVVEQELYDYIKEEEEVSIEDIKKDLGDKYLGASGKLLRRELITKGKKAVGEQSTGYESYGIKYVKILKIKEV